jgi:hypothetical protein
MSMNRTANILKYVRMGSSSNFGNMLSMAVASLFLPFLPLLATQILLNNLLYDLSEVGIPFDAVDPSDLSRPQRWNMHGIVRYAGIMGPLSSVSVRRDKLGLHSFLSMSLMEARRRKASAFRLRFSQSFASRLHRPSHANVLSTTHRFGRTTNPFA